MLARSLTAPGCQLAGCAPRLVSAAALLAARRKRVVRALINCHAAAMRCDGPLADTGVHGQRAAHSPHCTSAVCGSWHGWLRGPPRTAMSARCSGVSLLAARRSRYYCVVRSRYYGVVRSRYYCVVKSARRMAHRVSTTRMPTIGGLRPRAAAIISPLPARPGFLPSALVHHHHQHHHHDHHHPDWARGAAVS